MYCIEKNGITNCLRNSHFTNFKEKVIHIIYNEDFIMENLKHCGEIKIMKLPCAQLQEISAVVLHHSPYPPGYSEAILIVISSENTSFA